MLDTQYRMHPSIQAFPSRQWYGGRLFCGLPAQKMPQPIPGFPWPPMSDANVQLMRSQCPEAERQNSASTSPSAAAAARRPASRKSEDPGIRVRAEDAGMRVSGERKPPPRRLEA